MNKHTVTSTSEDLLKIFDTLDLYTVVTRALNYISTKCECENLIWTMEKPLTNILSALKTKMVLKDQVNSVELMAHSEINNEEIMKLVNNFSLEDKTLHKLNGEVICYERKSKLSDLFFPIINPNTQGIEASIIISGLSLVNKKYIEEKLNEIISQMSRHFIFSLEYWEVKELSFIDDVTELFNQRYLPMVLSKEIARAKRTNVAFTVLFLDIDYFKLVNDTRGHMVGSKVLVEIANLIKEAIRTNDYAFRYGGDEFVIILTEADAKAAEVVAERIRQTVESTIFNKGGPELKVTVSIGLAAVPEHAKSSEQVLQLADQAMYYAKNKSRNIVYVTAS